MAKWPRNSGTKRHMSRRRLQDLVIEKTCKPGRALEPGNCRSDRCHVAAFTRTPHFSCKRINSHAPAELKQLP